MNFFTYLHLFSHDWRLSEYFWITLYIIIILHFYLCIIYIYFIYLSIITSILDGDVLFKTSRVLVLNNLQFKTDLIYFKYELEWFVTHITRIRKFYIYFVIIITFLSKLYLFWCTVFIKYTLFDYIYLIVQFEN